MRVHFTAIERCAFENLSGKNPKELADVLVKKK